MAYADGQGGGLVLWCNEVVKIVAWPLLVNWYGIKMVKSPYNCVIYPLTQSQVANQQQKNRLTLINNCIEYNWLNK